MEMIIDKAEKAKAELRTFDNYYDMKCQWIAGGSANVQLLLDFQVSIRATRIAHVRGRDPRRGEV